MSRTITVRGMTCESCERTVEDAVEAVAGVTSVAADRTTETATVEGDPELAALLDAVEEAGYEALP